MGQRLGASGRPSAGHAEARVGNGEPDKERGRGARQSLQRPFAAQAGGSWQQGQARGVGGSCQAVVPKIGPKPGAA